MLLRRIQAGAVLGIAGLICSLLTASPARAADNSGDYICIGNVGVTSLACMDLKDDNFTEDEQIYVYNSSGNGLGWHFDAVGTVCDSSSCGGPGPFISGSGMNKRYNGRTVYYLEKTEGSGHNGCAGFYSPNLQVAWEHCGDYGTTWVYSSDDYLVNVDWSNATQFPQTMYASGTANGTEITLAGINGSGGYQVWYDDPQ